MAFEIKPAEYSHLALIADSIVFRSSSAVRKHTIEGVTDRDKVAFYLQAYKETLDSIRHTQPPQETVICAVEKSTGKAAAWAHWILPQGDSNPAYHTRDSMPPGGNDKLIEHVRARYKETRNKLLNGGQCLLLHNLYSLEEYSGQGAGSLLIRWGFEEADKLGLPIILGTRKEGYTIPLYQKHGFEFAASHDVDVYGKIVTYVQMMRQPNTTGKLTVGIIILSDTASKDPSTDRSEAVLREVFETEGNDRWNVNSTAILPDDKEQLRKKLLSWTGHEAGAGASPFNLIITTGGTGFALKDITPEVVEPLLERKAPGLVHLMLSSSLQITPFAAMARPVAGTRGKTMIVTLPGSPKGAKENLQAILKLLPHACQQSEGANSRTLHAGGVKKLESDAGITSSKAATSETSQGAHHHHHHHHGPGGHHGPAGPHTRPEDRPVPNNPNAGPSARHRESPYPKLPVAEALSRIFANTPSPAIEERPVNPDLVGYILAEDVTALNPVPAFRASIVDGYACITGSNGKNEKGTFPVASVSHAAPGTIPALEAGKIARITTGAPLPPNATAVIMVEDTVLKTKKADGKEEDEVSILTDQVKSGENVREVGSDIAQGSVVVKQGARVSAVGGELGVLASVGRASVKVYRKPVVGVMSTGDEIVPHDRSGALRLGEVRDTNRITLTTAIRGWGVPVVDLGIARDAEGALEAALRDALRRCDVIVTTGGVSMGELDLLKPTIERTLGGAIHFGRVAMKPGMPTTFATVPHKAMDGGDATALVFSLPGNPASGMVTASLFLKPCIDLWSGVADKKMLGAPRVKVVLDQSIRPDKVREEYQRAVVWQGDDGRLYGQTTGMQRSSRIGSFISANCLLVIPPGVDTLEKGHIVDGMLLSGLGHVG